MITLIAGLMQSLDPLLDEQPSKLLNDCFVLSTVFHALRPSRAPGFAYAWLELISHRLLMSKLLLNTPQQKVTTEIYVMKLHSPWFGKLG